jgi:AcrR family transcriptional regulator
MARHRMTREERKAKTKSMLVQAAARVIARRGVNGASIEEISESAGFSTGAFYASFKSKDDVFRALLEIDTLESKAMWERIDEAAMGQDRLRTGGRAIMEIEEWRLLLFIEILAHAARKPKFRPVVAEYWRSIRSQLSERIERDAREEGRPMPISADDFATVIIALGLGVRLQRLVDSDEVGEDLYPTVLSLFMTGQPDPDWKSS